MSDFNNFLVAALKAAEEENKKAKKPNADDYCETLGELYVTLQKVGFSETQAFELVKAIVS